MIRRSMQVSSAAALAGLAPHYLAARLGGLPLWTDAIGEWIMARTPNTYSVWLLEHLGEWAKPFAVTGGLFTLGLLCWVVAMAALSRWRVAATLGAGAAAAAAAGAIFEYSSLAGQAAFWVPALLATYWMTRPPAAHAVSAGRRRFLTLTAPGTLPLLMSGSTALVAAESFWRNREAARRAATPQPLFPFTPPPENFGGGLVRKAVTPVAEFYVMSKNAVDPTINPLEWRLRILLDGQPLRQFSYAELRSLPRLERYVTLRCISNTLKSNLMGTAYWSGILLRQIIDPRQVPGDIVEVAVVGVDGHGDSYPVAYALSEHAMLAYGMNGQTLNRDHGFPIRLLVPRYFGFKNVKWIDRIDLVSKPYYGTWPKMGYTKEATIHTTSYIDRVRTGDGVLRMGGVAYAGDRGVQAVQIRADQGRWVDAVCEPPLSPYTWTRWHGEISGARGAEIVEARAQDRTGAWQAVEPTQLFPNGVKGPTLRRIS